MRDKQVSHDLVKIRLSPSTMIYPKNPVEPPHTIPFKSTGHTSLDIVGTEDQDAASTINDSRRIYL